MIKVYTESNQIFSGSGAINSYAIDSAAATMDYEIFKAQPYLGGLYFALYSVYDDGVSQPTIVSHLPGNIIGHGGDQSPPLNKMQAVDTVDYNWIFARRGGTVMVPEATDLPADSVQLANNYLLSTSLNYLTTHDVALVSLQRNAKAKLK